MKGNEIMKKTMIKRMLSTASSAIMVSAMAASALNVFAAGTPNSGGSSPVIHSITPSNTTSFTVKKDIILFNVDGSTIFEPNVKYSYSVAKAEVSDGVTVTGLTLDENDADATVTVAVRKGIDGVVTLQGANGAGVTGTANNTAELVFGDDTTHGKTTNMETATISPGNTNTASRNLTVNIDATKFPANSPAGIYRYVIADITTDDTLTKAGIERDSTNYDKKRYLDVYTKYDDNGNLQVYGYVLLKGTSGKDTALTYDTTADETTKVTGFDTESETGAGGEYNAGTPNSDEYHTYNVEVKKIVDGSLADPVHEFPFKIDLANNDVKTAADFYYTQTGADEELTSLALNTGLWSLGALNNTSALKLKNNDTILITGLPVGTNITITENNDAPDTYTVSAKDTAGDNIGLICDAKTGTSLAVAANDSAAMATAFAVANKSGKDTITFTNELKSMSVTGIAFTAAPFALMLLAGTFFVGMFMKNRKKDENENVI